MPIDSDYVERSYFELGMRANHLLTLQAVLPGRDQFDSTFRLTPTSGENVEARVWLADVNVYHIDARDERCTADR